MSWGGDFMANSTQSISSIVLTPNQIAAPVTADSFIRAETDRTFAGFENGPGWNQRLDVDHDVPGDLGNHARARPIPGPTPPRMRWLYSYSSW
jgi:hypothetical protein